MIGVYSPKDKNITELKIEDIPAGTVELNLSGCKGTNFITR